MDEFEELRDDYAAKVKAREQRRLRKLWDAMPPTSNAIALRWLDPLIDGEPCDAEIVIAGEVHRMTVEPLIRSLERENKRRLKDYPREAEKWATWKWHTVRCTPVTDRDVYQVEPGFQPPVFTWAEAAPVVPVEAKRGPGRPRLAA